MALTELTERLPEVRDNVRERFDEAMDHLPDENVAEAGLGATLLAAGAATAATNIFRHRKGFGAWVLPATLMSSGIALFATGMLQRRSARIEDAEEIVLAELEELDPIARAQVLKDVTEKQVEHYLPDEG